MVLVTGGAGYIGSHTVVALLEAGHDAVIVDNFTNSHMEALHRVRLLTGRNIEIHRLNINDRGGLTAVFRKHAIDAVIHFAALKAVGESVKKPLDYFDNNLGTLTMLLKVMRDRDCFRLVFSSSATVYGTRSEPPFKEDAPLQATNPYGRTKLFAEELLRDVAAADARWRIPLLRYFNPVGAHPSGRIGESPRGAPNNLFPCVARVAAGTLTALNVFGSDYPTPDGTAIRDYIHISDLAEGHVAALEAFDRVRGAEAINLGTGRGCSVLQIIRAFERVSKRPVPYRLVARRPGDVGVSLANPAKAFDLLAWRAKRDLHAMCRDSWRWQEHNPTGYPQETADKNCHDGTTSNEEHTPEIVDPR